MDIDMDIDLSTPETPGIGTPKDNEDAYEYDRRSLETYLASVPYKCESIPEMQGKFQYLVGRLVVSVKSRAWAVANNYDHMIQGWLLLRYPVPTAMRVSLLKLYYELILVPGMDPVLVRGWADMLVKLIDNRGPGSKRKLHLSDMELDWRPLWKVLLKELFPKKRGLDNSRNMVNILLYVADQCKIYYSPNQIEAMLSTFLPLLTRDSYLIVVHVLASFLPRTACEKYVPFLFSLWESLNSHLVDERMLEIMGNLAVEHVTGSAHEEGTESGVPWKDVGIFSESQWTVLMGKCLGSFNIPVGATRGASTTGSHADGQADSQSLQIKKNTNRYNHLAQILVYSMSVDGPPRVIQSQNNEGGLENGLKRFLAGSRGLDTLERLITSTETYFHPSNAGIWTLCLTTFLHRVCAEFAKRWKEEEQSSCRTPLTHRLTPAIKRQFVLILRTPALLSMFSKDPVSMSFAQGALRIMAILQPSLVMPAILERAYSGLESINETHRTTAVLSTLSGVALPLISEHLWLGGQKHLLPLLELCLPGIDLNDPSKTICTTMFLVAVLQSVKIADLTQISSQRIISDDMGDTVMTNVEERLPDGTESDQTLDRAEERALVRDSTAGFADWVVSFFRRVFALYENLPEEGGKRNTTGGKQEESVIKSLKSTIDVICLHLSDPLFDFVLNLTYDYATSNAKSNAVRAFGGLIGCLARVKPEKTIKKFLPYCMEQIEIELRHGASNIRTTSTHGAIPSDTTLHWNMSILRGCMGYGGPSLLQHKGDILKLVSLLVDKTLSERGYTSTGRLVARILNTVTGVHPINSRFVNTDEWDDPAFDQDNFVYWGKLYEAKDVKAEWHVPSEGEIEFALEFLEQIVQPSIVKLETLLDQPKSTWGSVWRNDFCRYLHVVRSSWSGLPTIILEGQKKVVNPCILDGAEMAEFLPVPLRIEAGYTLTDPEDPRYQKVMTHKRQFGNLLHRASIALRESGAEDHIDAILSISRAIDIYLLEYGVTAGTFGALNKGYIIVRDLQRLWSKSKQFSRLVLLKRTQLYHSTRVYLNSMFRQRDELDDDLLRDLVELSLSPYTRVRRQGQSVLMDVMQHYIRSTRFTLPHLLDALAKNTDPDRMKGALYVLSSKSTASYAVKDRQYASRYIETLLNCQHQEKPSIQKLVSTTLIEALGNFTPEGFATHTYTMELPNVDTAISAIQLEYGLPDSQLPLLSKSMSTLNPTLLCKEKTYETMLKSALEVARAPTTHWRYVQAAARLLSHMIRRDIAPSPDVAQFFVESALSDHPSLRACSIRALVRLLRMVKIRSWSRTVEDLWLDNWQNPLSLVVHLDDPQVFMTNLHRPISDTSDRYFVDKLPTGFLVWSKDVKAYRPPGETGPTFVWESSSASVLKVLRQAIDESSWLEKLSSLWAQESSTAGNGTTDVRSDHIAFIKSLYKMFEDRHLETALTVLEPLWQDGDRFKQRAAAEIIQGILRASKHWPSQSSDKAWAWIVPRLPRILSAITPDTVQIWESVFSLQLRYWDPRRNRPLINFIRSLPLEFSGGSPFLMSKSISLIGIMVDCLGQRFEPYAEEYVQLFFDNADTGYAEIRAHIAADLDAVVKIQWHPGYTSTEDLLSAVMTQPDPLRLREVKHRERIQEFVRLFPEWKQARLPPPNQAQSQYDKVGLTLLQFIWTGAHSAFAPAIFPYSAPLLPSFLEMAELNDSSDLQVYSTAVLYVLSAVVPPHEYVETVATMFTEAIVSSTSWRVRLNALPTLAVFWYRNLTSFSEASMTKMMDVLMQCLEDENLEVREMAAKTLSSVLRSSQRHRILPLKEQFVGIVRRARLPSRQAPTYAETLKKLHAGILGIVALIDAYPYTVAPWMPSLCEELAPHATDPPPIAQTIRRCAADFKKTHQDMWHIDQHQFNEDQLQGLSTMLSGNSYYA
ncbi:ARM repeat-containing protein [Hysterangium stoloniferum]|nr:ARM repeat-containing protein [Hysterangium stoloniferum]